MPASWLVRKARKRLRSVFYASSFVLPLYCICLQKTAVLTMTEVGDKINEVKKKYEATVKIQVSLLFSLSVPVCWFVCCVFICQSVWLSVFECCLGPIMALYYRTGHLCLVIIIYGLPMCIRVRMCMQIIYNFTYQSFQAFKHKCFFYYCLCSKTYLIKSGHSFKPAKLKSQMCHLHTY